MSDAAIAWPRVQSRVAAGHGARHMEPRSPFSGTQGYMDRDAVLHEAAVYGGREVLLRHV